MLKFSEFFWIFKAVQFKIRVSTGMNPFFLCKLDRSRKIFFIFIFALTFFCQIEAADIQCEWKGIEKIVGIGDLHGDYENFVQILKGTKLVDEKLQWSGEKTHLVQMGDIMDRGPDARKIFDLLMQLERDAEKAGGKIHVLIGNHEEMNITGIAFSQKEYVTPEQFVSFLPEEFKKNKEKEFYQKIDDNSGSESELNPIMDKNLREFWQEIILKDEKARMEYIEFFNKNYGSWILQHNAVIKINNIVFVHGGISETYSTWKLKDINNQLRRQLKFIQRGKMPDPPVIVYDGNGPLWYRDLALRDEALMEEEVDRILQNLGANFLVTAHTPHGGSRISLDQMSRFNKRIWIIDTGISSFYGGHLSALIIERGDFSVWGINNEREKELDDFIFHVYLFEFHPFS